MWEHITFNATSIKNGHSRKIIYLMIQKKKKKGRKARSILEEYLIGWLTFDEIKYLYAVLNDVGSNPIKSTMYSFPFGDQEQEVLEEFQTSSPNTPNVSLMMNNHEGIILSFLNGPYGYHHYVFDEEGVVILPLHS